MDTRLSEAKLHGRRFPNVDSDLRSERRPCSGRTGPVPYFYQHPVSRHSDTEDEHDALDRRWHLEEPHRLSWRRLEHHL